MVWRPALTYSLSFLSLLELQKYTDCCRGYSAEEITSILRAILSYSQSSSRGRATSAKCVLFTHTHTHSPSLSLARARALSLSLSSLLTPPPCAVDRGFLLYPKSQCPGTIAV